jgi:hypothetical protein
MSTPTPTFTPSPTPIICGSGVTTGSFYYFDCCGSFIQGTSTGELVILDYTKSYNGVSLLQAPASTLCPTPTTTPTPSVSPTNTPSVTPTNTLSPTPTYTPTQTPTPTRVTTFKTKNDCDVITLFPLGVECQAINPSGPNALDGKLFLKITGGTSPYDITWEGGQKTPYLFNLGGGFYNVTVVDFYGDYTAFTNCQLIAPSPTPTQSPTPTFTPSPSPSISGLCFNIIWSDGNIVQLEFDFNGYLNGRPRWFDSTNNYYVQWSPIQGWRISGYTYQGSVLGSDTPLNIPTSGWGAIGGSNTATVNVYQGVCSSFSTLYFTLQTSPASCQNTCNGSVIVTPFGGTAPYQYSINNGLTYQSSNIFSNLCGGNYSITLLDSLGNLYSQSVTVANAGNVTSYSVGLQVLNTTTAGDQKQQTWNVVVSPPLPAGVTLSYNLNVGVSQLKQAPGNGTINYTLQVKKNSTTLTTTPQSNSASSPRPFCSPQIQTATTINEIYPISMVTGDVVSGTSLSTMVLTNPVNLNGCATNLTQSITVSLSNVLITGCNCCTAAYNQGNASMSQNVQVQISA